MHIITWKNLIAILILRLANTFYVAMMHNTNKRSNVMNKPKRAIVNLSDEQHEILKAAAARAGFHSIPTYMRVKALEAAKE